MSVPKSLRSKSELQVLYNADELAIYSIQVCSNEKIFPKRFRWTITDRIVGSAIKVAEYIEKANALRNDNEVDAELRKRYQRAAISELDGLTTLNACTSSIILDTWMT